MTMTLTEIAQIVSKIEDDLYDKVDEMVALKRRMHKLESINAELYSVVDRFVTVCDCDSAPPVEILKMIGALIEPARAARAKARGEEQQR